MVASGTQNRQLNLPRESRLLQAASGRETAASSRQKEIKNTGIAGFSGQTIPVFLFSGGIVGADTEEYHPSLLF